MYKVDQGPVGYKLPIQVPELISTDPEQPQESTSQQPDEMSGFALPSTPGTLSSPFLGDRLIPVPLVKSNNLNNITMMMMMMSGVIGGMFRGGSTRSSMSMPSSSPGLHLSSNASSPGLSYLHQDKKKTGCQVSAPSAGPHV